MRGGGGGGGAGGGGRGGGDGGDDGGTGDDGRACGGGGRGVGLGARLHGDPLPGEERVRGVDVPGLRHPVDALSEDERPAGRPPAPRLGGGKVVDQAQVLLEPFRAL